MTNLKFFYAASLLAVSSAFAATTPTAAPGTAQTASPAATPAAATPAAGTPSAADHHCRNEANEKHLTGAARAAFIKKCRADTPAR